MKSSIAMLLQGLSKSCVRESFRPSLYFLDSFGESLACEVADKNFSKVEIFLGGSGLPELKIPLAGVSLLSARVEVYGNPVGYFAVLYASGQEEQAKQILDFGKQLLGFAAEKHFELDDLSAALTRLFEERAFLYEITAELGSSSELSDYCARLAKRVATILEAPLSFVLLASGDREEYRVVGEFGVEGRVGESYPIQAGICGEVISSGKPRLVEDLAAVGAEGLSPVEKEGIRCLLATPIASGSSGTSLGALCVLDGGRSGSFTSEEMKLLGFIGEYVASLISGLYLVELKKEVQIAQRIVQGLLPDKAPHLSGFTLAGRLSPARVVGGDYFDYLPIAGGKTGVVIADVSGHTLPATLLMTVARAAFRWSAEDTVQAGPASILQTVCRRLFKDLSSAEFFMSMFLLVLEENRKVLFANAGHPPALLYRAKEKRFEELDGDGMVAGILRDIDFEEKQIVMEEGDLLILYTDGITEATAPEGEEMFGMERLKKVIQDSSTFPADQILEAVFLAVSAYSGGTPSDDWTVVVIQGAPIEQPVAVSAPSLPKTESKENP